MNKLIISSLMTALLPPAAAQAQNVCTVAEPARPIAAEVRETSGLAAGRANPEILWTHNDSGSDPHLFALAPDGSIRATVKLTHATLLDWEDMEAGSCGDGHCLYVADTGDNAGKRSHVTIYEIAEPTLPATEAASVRAIHARFADGAQDNEALFRLPNGEFYAVTKGRHRNITLYRLEQAGVDGYASLVPVRTLAERPRDERDRVTSATASPNGEFVAIRTYRTLMIYGTADLLGGGEPVLTMDLSTLGQKQGEAITLSDDGSIWLTSEAEDPKDQPTLARLSCPLPG